MDISKIAMYDCWYDYVKQKYEEMAKLWHMDTSLFVAHVKSEEFMLILLNMFRKDLKHETENQTVEK